MPELPEVETVCRGLAPWMEGSTLQQVRVHNSALRWPVQVDELQALEGLKIVQVWRRAKYCLVSFEGSQQVLMLHLGMSGNMRVLPVEEALQKHDHIELEINVASFGKRVVRFNDPRRFGCCLAITEPVEQHKLLASLGPEPLGSAFNAAYLHAHARNRKITIKSLIMDGKVVVGVGNIYASESLHMAGIRPGCAANRVSLARCEILVAKIKRVLSSAIEAGGTTLNDFTQSDGKPGYFRHELRVYGRAGEPCYECGTLITARIIAQRNTFYCAVCQT